LKRRILLLFGIVLLILAGVIAYFEIHFAHFVVEQVSISEEKALKEIPEIAFTEEDESLLREVITLPEVQAVLGTEEVLQISEEARAALERFIPEGVTEWDIYYIGTLHNNVNLYLRYGERKTVQYLVNEDLSSYEKAIGIYRKTLRGWTDVDGIYSNLNGEYTKYVEKRQWFHWLDEKF